MRESRTQCRRPRERKRAAGPLGQLLRDWRAARGMSQLDLALRAGFSTRHVSFIETGRTQPSRQALLAIAETLDVPLRERNRLLEAAGYAGVYRQTPLAADEMTHVRGVLQFILDHHEPYAAVVLDRYANCLMGNPSSAAGDGSAGRSVAARPARSTCCAPSSIRSACAAGSSTGTTSRGTCSARAERELGEFPDDEVGMALLEEIRGYAGPPAPPSSRPPLAFDLLLPVHIRKDGDRPAILQHHHDAGNAAGRDPAGAEDRDVLPSRRPLRVGAMKKMTARA